MSNLEVAAALAGLYVCYRVANWALHAKAARDWMRRAELTDGEIYALNHVNETSSDATIIAAMSAHEKLMAAVRLIDAGVNRTRDDLARQSSERQTA
jgi:hypothetical protein